MQLHHGMHHTLLRFGPVTLTVIWSLWWLRVPVSWWQADRVGGTLLVRLGSVVLVVWSPREGRTHV